MMLMVMKTIRVKGFSRKYDPAERSEICRNAVNARWAKYRLEKEKRRVPKEFLDVSYGEE